jgi:hypothetical protein
MYNSVDGYCCPAGICHLKLQGGRVFTSQRTAILAPIATRTLNLAELKVLFCLRCHNIKIITAIEKKSY